MPLIGYLQVPLEMIFEDKSNMADSYYGTFIYKKEPFTGKAIAYYDNGSIKTLRSFKEGKHHGVWSEWFANGNQKFRNNRIENKGHGTAKWWYENG